MSQVWLAITLIHIQQLYNIWQMSSAYIQKSAADITLSTSSLSLNYVAPNEQRWKEVDLYSAFIVVPHTQVSNSNNVLINVTLSRQRHCRDTEGAQVIWITVLYLQITPYLPLPRKHSPDGASLDSGCGHLIATYYSFIYPERMKGWVGLVDLLLLYV